jgi:hypothetical protein
MPPQVNVQGQDKRRDALFLLLYFILIVTAIISRRPDAVLHAQFWAEDGTIWFASAYNLGPVHTLTLPQNGYFATFPRLAAAIATLVPLASAPLVMNLLAIFVQALPPVFLLTRRFAYIGGQPVRLLMAFLILAVPTSAEVHANATNSMAFLALLAFLVLVAAPPDTKAGRVFDVAILCLSGATGPFAVLLLPVAFLMYWIRRRPWSAVLLGIECSAAVVQAVAIVTTAAGTRSSQALGATPMLLFRIVGGQVIVSPLLGMRFLIVRPAIANLVCAVAFAGALLLLVYVVRRAPLELRLFMVFTVTLLAAALRSPLASLTEPQWPVLTTPGAAGRYWLIPVISFFWVYVWMLGRQRPAVIRAVGALAIAAVLWTGHTYWRYQPFVNLNFTKYASEFRSVPAGQDFTIPINPQGWQLILHKH